MCETETRFVAEARPVRALLLRRLTTPMQTNSRQNEKKKKKKRKTHAEQMSNGDVCELRVYAVCERLNGLE